MSRNLALRPIFVLLSLASAMPAFASRPYVVEERTVSKLRAGGQKLTIEQMPMFDGNPATLVLERFEVWAPDAQIIKYDKDRKETRVPRPTTKFYRGRISDDLDSLVFMSVEVNGQISGMALSGDGKRKLSIRRGVRAGGTAGPRRDDADAPLMVREFDEVDDATTFGENGAFHCDVEGRDMKIVEQLAALKPQPQGNTPPSVTTGYGLNLAIETDGELYNAFGSDPAITTYLGNLIGAASTIYQRDLKTTLTIGTTHLWSGGIASDPWTVLPASGTGAALSEFGLYWHNNYAAVNRSSVVFVSGKAFFGGVAWFNQLCTNDFFCGAGGANCGSATYAGSYAGGYAFCGSTAITTTVPDPNATVNGVQYALPNNNNFWMLLEVCHELGHNANGDHTHCVPLSAAQQVLYGVVGRPYIDLCHSGEAGCYLGAESSPAELGTIMSYCHNISVGGFRQSRYLFGKAGEPSELMFASFTAAFDAATPNGAITLGAAEPLPCAAGQTASVTAASSMAWQITGGAITSATNIASITFTPSAPSVVLTVTVGNTKGCSITSQRTATALCGSLPAPASVDAHATSITSVQISWPSVPTATSYEVARLDTLGSAYSTLGATSMLNFTDSTVSVNKAYLYKVRAVAPTTGSYSNPDLATVVIYANPTLTATSSIVNAQDLVDVRSAAQAVRTLANQGVFSFTDPTITPGVTLISAVHQSQLRTVVNGAFTALSLTAISYTNPTPVIGATISAADMNNLRNGMY
jgi:metallopeptidase family M12-like protein